MPAEPFGKRASPGVALPAGGETGPSPASLETQWTKTGLNLAGGGCLVYTASWNWSVTTGIPAKIELEVALLEDCLVTERGEKDLKPEMP